MFQISSEVFFKELNNFKRLFTVKVLLKINSRYKFYAPSA